MEKKIKRITNVEKVYTFLKEKKLAVTKKQIAQQLGMKATSVNRACRILKKEKKIGCMFTYWGSFGHVQKKSYWGIMHYS